MNWLVFILMKQIKEKKKKLAGGKDPEKVNPTKKEQPPPGVELGKRG